MDYKQNMYELSNMKNSSGNFHFSSVRFFCVYLFFSLLLL